MYWVVYTFFTVGELFSDVLLSWIPFYYPLKLALLVWCLKYDGAQQLYRSTFGKLLMVRPLSCQRLASTAYLLRATCWSAAIRAADYSSY